MRLFTRSFPHARFFARTGLVDPSQVRNLPPFDVQIAAGSVPRRLRRSLDSFPTHAGYLTPKPRQVDEWRTRFERLGAGLVVGISWRGGKDAATRRRRSTTVCAMGAAVQNSGIAFVNLQYGDCRADIAEFARDFGVTLHQWDDADPLRDLDGFAAQIAALDLVISVDNATVHMAGALNTPVWTLLPFSCDWRWFIRGDESPWYPSMRLFRQASFREMALGDWNEVFHRVSHALENLAPERADEQGSGPSRLHGEAAWPRPSNVIYGRRRCGPGMPKRSTTWAWHGRTVAAPIWLWPLTDRPSTLSRISPFPWFNCGNAHREDNHLVDAVACYQEAHRRDPENPQILVNLAVTLKDLRRLDGVGGLSRRSAAEISRNFLRHDLTVR